MYLHLQQFLFLYDLLCDRYSFCNCFVRDCGHDQSNVTCDVIQTIKEKLSIKENLRKNSNTNKNLSDSLPVAPVTLRDIKDAATPSVKYRTKKVCDSYFVYTFI